MLLPVLFLLRELMSSGPCATSHLPAVDTTLRGPRDFAPIIAEVEEARSWYARYSKAAKGFSKAWQSKGKKAKGSKGDD